MTASENDQALSQLIGLPFRSIGRACNLLWLQFGEWREVPAWRSGTKTVGNWAIHVQCDWSMSKSGAQMVSSADYYLSPEGKDLGNDWDIPGTSRFDAITSALRAKFETAPPAVLSVTCDEATGFSMHFDDGSQLDVNPSKARFEEYWRLFRPSTNDTHFVVPSEP